MNWLVVHQIFIGEKLLNLGDFFEKLVCSYSFAAILNFVYC